MYTYTENALHKTVNTLKQSTILEGILKLMVTLNEII